MDPRCPLCRAPGGPLLWRGAACRLILVEDPALPGYCRVVWERHVREVSDLSIGEAQHLHRVVSAAERAVREVAAPSKVNVASLGNVVPHLHVHVVPRFEGDPWWPGPVWSGPLRATPPRPPCDPARLRAMFLRHLSGAS